MPYSHIIPVLSLTSGGNNDGALIGSVLESNFAGAFTDVHIADNVYVYRKDLTGSSFSFENISTAAGNDTTSDFLPFGTNTQMTAGDKFYLSCDHEIEELFFKIDTPGVWTGTMTIKYSTDGQTASATVQGVVDDTNGFKAAQGIHKITFTKPTNIVAFSPVPGDVPSKKWFVFEPTITAVTTAPILSRVWIHHSEDASIDMSSLINLDVITSGGGHPPTFFPIVDSATYYAFSNPAFGMERRIFRRQDNVRTRVVEYYANDNTWKPLQGWNDPSDDFRNGPATQAATATQYSVRWTVPSDWSSKTLSFTTSSGAVQKTGYFIRERTTAVSAYGPAQTTLSNVSARQFGDANTAGVVVPIATTIRAITLDEPLSISGTGENVIQIFNLTKGTSTSATIPATPTWPLNIDVTDISLSANDKYGVFVTSGSRVLTSTALTIHT